MTIIHMGSVYISIFEIFLSIHDIVNFWLNMFSHLSLWQCRRVLLRCAAEDPSKVMLILFLVFACGQKNCLGLLSVAATDVRVASLMLLRYSICSGEPVSQLFSKGSPD